MSMDDLVVLEGEELARFLEWVEDWTSGRVPVTRLRVCVDDGTLKLKNGESTWSPPMGYRDPACMAARPEPCPETTLGGDHSWPVRLRCVEAKGHEGAHRDRERGLWVYRQGPVPLLP